MSKRHKKVMVIGGGIAGLTVAWELSKDGIQVELVEKKCFLGGHAIGFTCKASGECLQCGACLVEEMLKNVVNEPLITIHLATEIENVTGDDNFSVILKKSNSSVMEDSKDVVRGHSVNNNPFYVIVNKKNEEKKNLEKAVPFETLGTEGTIDVDALIVATGFKPFDAKIKATYGYNKFNNVITGLDLERIIRENGNIIRPSDGKVPKKIAFIQCVGSRDERLGNLWCSHVCCPYALRCAKLIKHKNSEAEITIFYIDIQNTCKDFSAFYELCKSDFKFVRNIPVDVIPIKKDRLQMRYLNEAKGLPISDEFDLLVLSIGITPNNDNNVLSDQLEIELDKDGFFEDYNQTAGTLTSRQGVFIAGTCHGPKSIQDSMAHSRQATFEVMKYLEVLK